LTHSKPQIVQDKKQLCWQGLSCLAVGGAGFTGDFADEPPVTTKLHVPNMKPVIHQ